MKRNFCVGYLKSLSTDNNILSCTKSISFDSYMVYEDELLSGELRLLQTNNALILPKNVHIRLIVTSSDVIHSLSLPAFGIKVDAVPGRLNSVLFYAKHSGTFFGQCSELCGINHAFMPIEVWVIDFKLFSNLLLVSGTT
jgi:cytochrome c oxidase subunit 2